MEETQCYSLGVHEAQQYTRTPGSEECAAEWQAICSWLGGCLCCLHASPSPSPPPLSLSLYTHTHTQIRLIASFFSIIPQRNNDNHSNGILCSDGMNIIHVRTLLFAFLLLRDVILFLTCLVTELFALKIKQLKARKCFCSISLNTRHAENVSKKTVYI
jgi:hypothetical protein